MCNLFFKFLLLKVGHSDSLHFLIKLLPILSFLLLEMDHFGISLFDEILGGFNFLFSGFGDGYIFVFIVHGLL